VRLLATLADPRVLLAIGVALLLQLAFGAAWMLTAGREIERVQAEIDALPPEQRMNAEFDRMGRLVEEFTGEKPDLEGLVAPPIPDLEPGAADDQELEAQIEALQRQAMVRSAPARPPEPDTPTVRRARRKSEPFLMTNLGILTVSCSVGLAILLVGGAISFVLLRSGGGERGPDEAR
jgi:hypothetical protein